jgi:hypothetical protein
VKTDTVVMIRRILALVAAITLLGAFASCKAEDASTPLTTTPTAAAATYPVVVAAGDIACDPLKALPTATQCQQKLTSDLVIAQNPTKVINLGDNQYREGTAAQFSMGYAPTWGRFKDRTTPVVGNHEYYDPAGDAKGYRDYFGNPGGVDLSYAYSLGNWRILILNSECGELAKYTDRDCAWLASWIKRDITNNPKKCILAAWHRPLRSTSQEGYGTSTVRPFWDALYSKRADIVLNGHAHNFEEWEKLTPGGSRSSTGIKQFTVGTGGRSQYSFARWDDRIAGDHRTKDFGVLKLTLKDSSYDYSFISKTGARWTSSRSCN